MSVRPDHWIEKMVETYRLIEPFEKRQMSNAVISYGLSCYGYDMRLANQFKVPRTDSLSLMDPKHLGESDYETVETDTYVLPPHHLVLGRSVEYFRIPRNVITVTQGKSTYARCGILVNVTPFEPEWEGFVTIAISNISTLPAKLYAGEGICQVLFFESDSPCRISYADKKGKYQAQQGITPARMKK